MASIIAACGHIHKSLKRQDMQHRQLLELPPHRLELLCRISMYKRMQTTKDKKSNMSRNMCVCLRLTGLNFSGSSQLCVLFCSA
jgi:hypothetical protein